MLLKTYIIILKNKNFFRFVPLYHYRSRQWRFLYMNKKLYRSRNNKNSCRGVRWISGYFEIDVTIVRLIMVAFFLLSAGFPTIIAYIIAALIIPEEPIYNDGNKNNYENVNYTVNKED